MFGVFFDGFQGIGFKLPLPLEIRLTSRAYEALRPRSAQVAFENAILPWTSMACRSISPSAR
jgi:hypothetical protein